MLPQIHSASPPEQRPRAVGLPRWVASPGRSDRLCFEFFPKVDGFPDLQQRVRPASFAPRPRPHSDGVATGRHWLGGRLCPFPGVTAGVTGDKRWSPEGRACPLPSPQAGGTARGKDSLSIW